ncbi:MAG: TetR/AcrR family transcriptional regulator [Methylococcaceae bacterium]
MVGGRQLQFDKQEALEAAMTIFWKKGFLGASLADLTSSMGINKPSLYATFGNKEDLFVSATEHYLSNHATPHILLLNTPNQSLSERLTAYLFSVTTMLCDPSKPGGCFISVATNEAAGESLPEKAYQAVIKASNFTETYLTEFFTSEKDKGNLTTDIGIRNLTLFIITFLHGIAAMARNGKTPQQIKSIVDIAVKVLKL